MIDYDQNIRDEQEFAKTCTIDIMHVKKIPYEEYRAHPALNQTFLRHVLEHGLNKAKDMRANPEEPTDDMILGSVHHAYLSQNVDIQRKYERVPKVDLRTKEGKAIWKALEESAGPGVTLVKENLWDKAHLLAQKAKEVRKDVLGIETIEENHTEVSLVAKVRMKTEAKVVDFDLKGQLDLVWTQGAGKPVLVIDYKTSSSCAEVPVARKSRDSMWPLQAYVYASLAAAYWQAPASAYYIVSSKETETARAYSFGPDSMTNGRYLMACAAYRAETQLENDAKHYGITLL